ncbi:MAG TPA: prolipoprotein diacylglyceryl transferase [Acidimicrobiia bacterium]|nr:prolipoprotein diacylglyceryl transferase [Acidimicrobiia bacterium]
MLSPAQRVVGVLLDYDPIVKLELGPLSISPHGLGIALGYVLGGMLFMLPAAKRRGITAEQVVALLERGALGAIVGARLAYVINHPGDYTDDPLEIFKVWEGGISLLGGITGAVLAAATKMRSEGISFWKVMDAVAPGLAFGIIIGRLGDLAIADHLGKPTDFFLGYRCPEGPLIPGDTIGSACAAGPGGIVHQPAFYDLVSTIALVLFLLWLRRRPRYDGYLTLVFAAWYGAARVVEDFFRIDETHGTGLTGSQWTALVTLIAVVFWLVVKRRTPWASGKGGLRSEATDEVHDYDSPPARAAFAERVDVTGEASAPNDAA